MKTIRVITVAFAVAPDAQIDLLYDALSDERDRGTFIEWAVVPDSEGRRHSKLVDAEDACDVFCSPRITPDFDDEPKVSP